MVTAVRSGRRLRCSSGTTAERKKEPRRRLSPFNQHTFTKRSLAFSASMPLNAAQASQRALPSKSRPPRSAHMGRSVWLSPWVACQDEHGRRSKFSASACRSRYEPALCLLAVRSRGTFKLLLLAHLHVQGVQAVKVVRLDSCTARPCNHAPVQLGVPAVLAAAECCDECETAERR